MAEHSLLLDFLLLLGVSIPVVYAFNRLRLPSIVGFLVTGIMAGPSALGLISRTEAVQAMAEIGIVLLLFSIGLEFSLKELFAMGFRALGVGVAQVIATVGITAGIGTNFGLDWRTATVLGFLVALSSSAIVLKILSDREETSTPHGKVIVGISLTQDLCIIPMMMLVPALSGETFDPLQLAYRLALAMGTLAVLILVARYGVPLILAHIARQRNRDLFLVTVIFVILGIALASGAMGLSLAIGAFIAGLVISESSYSHQVLSDILPFRDIFNAIFFVSVGMLLDVSLVATHWRMDILLAAGIFAGKAAVILLILTASRQIFRVSWITALSLAQTGEFSLLLAQQARGSALLAETPYQVFLASCVLTMLMTPFAIQIAGPMAERLQKRRREAGSPVETSHEEMKNHLMIIGFGLNGRNLANVVRDVAIPFVVIELNDRLVMQAAAEGVPVLFGDATRRDILARAGAGRARMAVVAISDSRATRTVVAVLRNLNPNLVILVRTRYVAEVDLLIQLGANLVIPEEYETSVEIFARVLEQYGIPDHLIGQQVAIIRSEGYGMLRGLSVSQERLMKISELFLKSTIQQHVVREASRAVGRSIRELNLRSETGVSILVVIRGESAHNNPDAGFRLEAGDILVLWGAHQQLADALRVLE